ncbi:putative uncharacterized protein [Clostridium sp. CAG:575]|nr:putative uncharacterized protein [Clostridium sp. CAG:575]
MRYFSFNDYEDYTNKKRGGNIQKLEDKTVKYKLIETENYVRTNKISRNINNVSNEIKGSEDDDEVIKILKDKANLIKFLYTVFNFKTKILAENLKLCTNIIKINDCKESFDNTNFILYKLSNEQKYFYIEHINKLDYNIAYKMFVVSMKIIENWSKEKKLKSKYPIVFPIVIYSGEEEWDIVKNQNRLKIRYTTYERSSINLAYNIVNIKDIKFKFTK